jgi:hypothetical protein
MPALRVAHGFGNVWLWRIVCPTSHWWVGGGSFRAVHEVHGPFAHVAASTWNPNGLASSPEAVIAHARLDMPLAELQALSQNDIRARLY